MEGVLTMNVGVMPKTAGGLGGSIRGAFGIIGCRQCVCDKTELCDKQTNKQTNKQTKQYPVRLDVYTDGHSAARGQRYQRGQRGQRSKEQLHLYCAMAAIDGFPRSRNCEIVGFRTVAQRTPFRPCEYLIQSYR